MTGAGALPDLDRRPEIEDMVVELYRAVAMDDLFGPIFEDVASIDWAAHVPHLADYWCRVLLGEAGYTGRIVDAHRRLHDLAPLGADHFDRWFELFSTTVAEGWAGPSADRAVAHAATMARSLARIVADTDWHPPRRATAPA
ncbi:MAG: group III truncated hemoglobin [Actinomycetota bacterium]|nr:group III truncated hemoglobin [Actinomycetota bacterium]